MIENKNIEDYNPWIWRTSEEFEYTELRSALVRMVGNDVCKYIVDYTDLSILRKNLNLLNFETEIFNHQIINDGVKFSVKFMGVDPTKEKIIEFELFSPEKRFNFNDL